MTRVRFDGAGIPAVGGGFYMSFSGSTGINHSRNTSPRKFGGHEHGHGHGHGRMGGNSGASPGHGGSISGLLHGVSSSADWMHNRKHMNAKALPNAFVRRNRTTPTTTINTSSSRSTNLNAGFYTSFEDDANHNGRYAADRCDSNSNRNSDFESDDDCDRG